MLLNPDRTRVSVPLPPFIYSGKEVTFEKSNISLLEAPSITSRHSPTMKVSSPDPPSRASDPGPPSRISSPWSPKITSSPAPPVIVSSPFLPKIVSLRSVPVKTSFSAVPVRFVRESALVYVENLERRFLSKVSSSSLPKSLNLLD